MERFYSLIDGVKVTATSSPSGERNRLTFDPKVPSCLSRAFDARAIRGRLKHSPRSPLQVRAMLGEWEHYRAKNQSQNRIALPVEEAIEQNINLIETPDTNLVVIMKDGKIYKNILQ